MSDLPVLAAYLRVGSLGIAVYDYLSTIPGEWRLYGRQPSFRRTSKACWLFIGVRYVTIAALVTSSIGFFGRGFSVTACHHFHVVAPVLKLFATLISQVIIGMRTYAVSRGRRSVGVILIMVFVLSLAPEILGNVVGRKPLQTKHGNCTSGNLKNAQFAWLHYLAAMVYDTVAMAITSFYLIPQLSIWTPRPSRTPGTFLDRSLSSSPSLTTLLLREGLLFFIALTSVNVLNLIFFRLDNLSLQSGAATLGQAVTMIFSQKFILNLSEHVNGTSMTPSSRDIRAPVSRSYGRRPIVTPRGDTFELSGIEVTTEVRVDGDSIENGKMSHVSPTSPNGEKGQSVYWGSAA